MIMICAMLPLFTMTGPEGQIFGPMADTYAFALGGALMLALTVSPVLCMMLFKNLRPGRDNILVHGLKTVALAQMNFLLRTPPRRAEHFRDVWFSARSVICRSWGGNSCRNWKKAT